MRDRPLIDMDDTSWIPPEYGGGDTTIIGDWLPPISRGPLDDEPLIIPPLTYTPPPQTSLPMITPISTQQQPIVIGPATRSTADVSFEIDETTLLVAAGIIALILIMK